MTAHTAVRINDNLAASQTAVALRSTDYESSGRVDEAFGVVRQHVLRQNLLNDLLDTELLDLGMINVRSVLRRNDDVYDARWLSINILDDTWLLASGRSHFTFPAFRTRVSSRPKRWANIIGAGISSGVSLHA